MMELDGQSLSTLDQTAPSATKANHEQHQYNPTEGWPNTADIKFSATDGAAAFSADEDLVADGAATFSADEDLVAANDGATTGVPNNNRGGTGNK